MKDKLYLKGAYGPGNLGDDVLMLAIINIIRKARPDIELLVGVESVIDAGKLTDTVKWIDWKTPCKVKYFVYGGGGQFFNFTAYEEGAGGSKNILEKLFEFISRNKNLKNAVLRVLFSVIGASEKLVLADRVAAYCIGIGPFESKGYGYERTLKFLQKVEFLTVRDNVSLNYALDLGAKAAKLYADPTFDKSAWYDGVPIEYADKGIAIIVRYWPFSHIGERMVNKCFELADKLISEGEDVNLVIFDERKDYHLLEKYPEYKWHIYNPALCNPNVFLREMLSSSKYIVSCRAHGVWLPSILGVPVLAIEMEPKLKKVHDSLKNSSMLFCGDEPILNKFHEYKSNYDFLKGNLKLEISTGEELAKFAKSDFSEWLNDCE